MQKQVSIRVPEDLKKKMEEHREINWSEVFRKAAWEYLDKVELADEIASKSKLTEKEAKKLAKKHKKSMAKHYSEES